MIHYYQSLKRFLRSFAAVKTYEKISLKSVQQKLHLHVFSKNFKGRVRGRTAM